jgi:hypothetical protein
LRQALLPNRLSVLKMSSDANVFEISEIQEDETEDIAKAGRAM